MYNTTHVHVPDEIISTAQQLLQLLPCSTVDNNKYAPHNIAQHW